MTGELEFRNAQLTDVSYPRRQIELVVMPYETPTTIEVGSQKFTEIVSRGAFDGIERRTSSISVNADHKTDVANTIGKTLALHPSRAAGLVAEVRISKGDLGDHALELAADGALGASAGFALLRDQATGNIKQNAEVWEGRSRRRLNHLWLHHIALTPTPAYDMAEVLAVRQEGFQGPLRPSQRSHPNLERLELMRLRELADGINRRYAAGQH